ncbi:MAG: M23 family metallopeptidase [Cyanobacteria bacterium Co-bin13]|nr:M23 family metallopeptidase [Cyanobacteria bacterium Co-bin13]
MAIKSLLMAASLGVAIWQMAPGLAAAGTLQAGDQANRVAQAAPGGRDRTAVCPPSALARVTRHRIQSGETLEAIAEQYNLVAPTLLRLNPSLQNGLPLGQEILVPPFNGIVVTVPRGQTWEQVANQYQSRADVLFESNGCQATVPERIFVPGLTWLTRGTAIAAAEGTPSPSSSPVRGYPLPQETRILTAYGWQPDPIEARLVFNTGVTLAAPPGTAVIAAGDGTVAFAGQDGVYGNLVVINHQQGLQTRYANLASVAVAVGQSVRQGNSLGTIAEESAETSFLFFEVRRNSDLGWIAQDPQDYIPALAIR